MDDHRPETDSTPSEKTEDTVADQDLNGFVSIPDRVLLQTVADEVVFLNLDNGTYYGLDPIGARMLHLAMRLEDVSSVATTMEEEYETTVDILERDVDHLLNELSSEGLVVRHDVAEPDFSPDDPAEQTSEADALSPDDEGPGTSDSSMDGPDAPAS